MVPGLDSESTSPEGISGRKSEEGKFGCDLFWEICKEIADEAKEEREGKSPLGVHRAERMHPHFKPDATAHSPAPLVHCADHEDRHRFKNAYKAFVDAFWDACDSLVQQEWGRGFPEGGLPPLWELKATP